MEALLTPSRRADAIDAEQFGQMIESEYFRRFIARVKAERDRAVEACLTTGDDLPLRRAQGAQAALRSVLELPELMLAEMRGKPRYSLPNGHIASNTRT